MSIPGRRKWLAGFLGAFILFLGWPLNESRIRGASSVVLLSQEGVELRHFREPTGAYAEWLALEEYPDFLRQTVIAAEDKRFYYHPGFDPFAFFRAIYQNVTLGRVVSGGSTITQQLCRLAYAGWMPENDYARKAVEIAFALRLTFHLSKERVLEAYLNRVPLKFNRLGLASASRGIFGKSPRMLAKEEAVALAVLIRQSAVSPALFRIRYRDLYERVYPGEEPDEDLLNEITKAIHSGGAENTDIIFRSDRAPHFVEWFDQKYSSGQSSGGGLNTEISSDLSGKISEMINAELAALGKNNATNAAAVVLELRNGKLFLRAMVGSKDFLNQDGGQVNGALAIRTAGSSLKPFIYGKAMESLGLRSWDIIQDSDISISTDVPGETYRPRNYDLNYWGNITVRESLATSRNIPAVALVEKIGLDHYFELLNSVGIDHMKNSPSYYGPGAALGTIGVSLFDLTRAYSVFPAEGVLLPLVIGKNKNGEIQYGKSVKVFDKETAYSITHILSDGSVRRKAFGKRSFLDFPFDVAAKTGTSKDYRDSWTVGYTSQYIVGVWVGNFSGVEMKNISGVFGAGRIFQQTMRLLYPENRHTFSYPESSREEIFCRISGKKAGTDCPSQIDLVFESGPEICDGNHQENTHTDKNLIISPVQGEVFLIDPHSPRDIQGIPIRLNNPGGPGNAYQIDDGKKWEYENSVTRIFSLPEGSHQIKIYRDDTILEEVSFEVR